MDKDIGNLKTDY